MNYVFVRMQQSLAIIQQSLTIVFALVGPFLLSLFATVIQIIFTFHQCMQCSRSSKFKGIVSVPSFLMSFGFSTSHHKSFNVSQNFQEIEITLFSAFQNSFHSMAHLKCGDYLTCKLSFTKWDGITTCTV